MTKPTKWHVCPVKTQISLGICPVWSESSLSAWRNLGSLATHWVHSEDSDQTGQMPRLIWVFAGCIVILLVLSWGGSFFSTPEFQTLCLCIEKHWLYGKWMMNCLFSEAFYFFNCLMIIFEYSLQFFIFPFIEFIWKVLHSMFMLLTELINQWLMLYNRSNGIESPYWLPFLDHL